jgi:archaellum component FlaG (FlaF/FlaG flagellin family)
VSSVEELLFFAVAAVVAGVVVFQFINTTNIAASKGTSAANAVAQSQSRSFCIPSVYSDGTDTNVYLYGVSGAYRMGDVRVYVDGFDANIISSGFVSDRDGDGYLDPHDSYYIELNQNVVDGDLHNVEVCIGAECRRVDVLENGDGESC